MPSGSLVLCHSGKRRYRDSIPVPFKMESDMSEKNDILEETQQIISPDDSMGIRFLGRIALGVTFVLLVVFPKIFINTQIYFNSREISTLSHEHDALMEENRLIKAKVELMKYKSQVADTLF